MTTPPQTITLPPEQVVELLRALDIITEILRPKLGPPIPSEEIKDKILSLIPFEGTTASAVTARTTHLNRKMRNLILGDLVSRGLIKQVLRKPSGKGRPTTHLFRTP